MAAMKTEGGTRYPASAYLVVENPAMPSTWHLRVRGPDGALDPRLLGAAHAALLSSGGFRGNRYQGPQKQAAIAKLKRLYAAANLDWPEAGMGAEGDPDELVTRRGLIFRAGTYESHNITVTPEDIRAAVASFAGPVPIELEHFSTQGRGHALEGELGQLVGLSASEDGTELYGETRLPRWLDAILSRRGGAKVSAVWNRATKAFSRLGIVLNPAIPDAAVFADVGDEARLPLPEEGFASRRHSGADLADIQQIHDLAQRQGAACDDDHPTAAMAAPAEQRRPRMHLDSLKFWRNLGRRARDEARDQGLAVPEEEVFSILDHEADEERERVRQQELAAFAAQKDEAERRLKDANDQLLRANALRVQAEAVGFADGLITAGKIFPAEREQTIALFCQAASDDAQHGAAAFSADGTASRVDLLKRGYEARPAHGLAGEQVAGATFSVLASGQGAPPPAKDQPTPAGKPISDERRAHLKALASLQ